MQVYQENAPGESFGNEAAEHVARRAEAYCDHERDRITLTNEPRIVALAMEGEFLYDRAQEIEEHRRQADATLSGKRRRWQIAYYGAVSGILVVAAFCFSIIALAPFRIGPIGYLYCLGIAIVTPFGVEEFLKSWNSERLLKGLATAVFLAAAVGGALLAEIRADLLAQQVQTSAPAVVFEDQTSAPAPIERRESFYDSTRTSLRIFMILVAFAIDIGAGIAAHRAVVIGRVSGGDFEALTRECDVLNQRLFEIAYEITDLRNAPGVFVARFWRDFYRALLADTVRNAVKRFGPFMLLLVLLGSSRVFAQAPPDVIIALDLSASESVKRHGAITALAENMRGIEGILTSIQAGSRVTVIGITEKSFSDPYIILRAGISADTGFFGERLAGARSSVVAAWRRRATSLTPTGRSTDIFGALRFADQLFDGLPGKHPKILILYSDMRQATGELDLETQRMVPADSLDRVRQRRLFVDLRGVTVFVLGAKADGWQIPEWESLNEFWAGYFENAGAHLLQYSVLPDPPKSLEFGLIGN